MSPTIPIARENFWRCILVLVHNFHVINKKIFAGKVEEIYKIKKGISEVAGKNVKFECTQSVLNNGSIDAAASSEKELEELLRGCPTDCGDQNHRTEGFIIWFKFLTKRQIDANSIRAVGIIDFINYQYTCQFHTSSFDDFSVRLTSRGELDVQILSSRTNIETSIRWANFVLKSKLLNWTNSVKDSNAPAKSMQSLELVDVEEYNSLYQALKTKHSQNALNFWSKSKESTDPLKFIYEDLAIAAYLIVLWRSTSTVPSAFADLGCGNGLLVYILNEEGFHGYGYDIRSRNIWSYYPLKTQAQLIEQAIEPNKFKLPSEVDWLIGNHSDELSPWLPVIAACSRYEIKYFLLPCCAYEFSGLKFQRRNSKLSCYMDFLNYAREVSRNCGFVTLTDRLKIPSTKRIALVGIERTYAKGDFQQQSVTVQQYVNFERRGDKEIKLREKIQVVRNCTQIEKSILDCLVRRIFQFLLTDTENTLESTEKLVWNAGRKVAIKDLLQSLTREDLKSIKSECGGLKTLLKNKHEIFEFCGGDLVQIRKPQIRQNSAASTNKPQTIKKRMCFFDENHPNGCPLSDSECTFLHV